MHKSAGHYHYLRPCTTKSAIETVAGGIERMRTICVSTDT